MIKLTYLVSHPIQYQAPLLRKIAEHPEIGLTVFFLTDLSVEDFKDKGFGKKIEWDVPLLDGYEYQFLPAWGRTDKISFWRPFVHGLKSALEKGNFDALWVHGYYHWSYIRAIRLAKKMDIKILMRGESNLISVPQNHVKKTVKNLFLQRLFGMCDGFLCIGSLNREYYRHYDVPEYKLFSMPYAVDNDFFQQRCKEASENREQFRQELGLEPDRPIILYAGKLMSRKRPGDLLEAYIRLSPDKKKEPQPYLLFVGDGEKRSNLERRVQTLGWSSVKFTGFQNQTKLPAFYDLCDVFVLPSVYEPWGLVVNEVMNAGKPVIASDQVGCAPDLVKDGVNGRIFPARDIEALKRCLEEILTNGQSEKMGRESLQIINNWSFDEDLDGLLEALQSV